MLCILSYYIMHTLYHTCGMCIHARSMILSVDMAHAVHPNYASKHDKLHAPRMNAGIVIKTNVNQVCLILAVSLVVIAYTYYIVIVYIMQ